jgi:isoquinoline 1-oxidoreductase subunit alpha
VSIRLEKLWQDRRTTRTGEAELVRLTVNGRPRELDLEPEMPLLWVLRDELHIMGPKYGCGIGECGACTVHMDGEPVRACSVPLAAAAGRRIVTIEGLAQGGRLHPVQQAWIEHQVPQCGYCQSGVIMAVAALLERNPSASDAEVEAAVTNICRCGTYERIRGAIHSLTGAGEASNV